MSSTGSCWVSERVVNALEEGCIGAGGWVGLGFQVDAKESQNVTNWPTD